MVHPRSTSARRLPPPAARQSEHRRAGPGGPRGPRGHRGGREELRVAGVQRIQGETTGALVKKKHGGANLAKFGL